VEKADLIIESEPDETFLKAHCSSCEARFDLMGNGLTEKELLRAMFDLHTRRAHSPKPRHEFAGLAPVNSDVLLSAGAGDSFL
jgi:hypothetical protein